MCDFFAIFSCQKEIDIFVFVHELNVGCDWETFFLWFFDKKEKSSAVLIKLVCKWSYWISFCAHFRCECVCVCVCIYIPRECRHRVLENGTKKRNRERKKTIAEYGLFHLRMAFICKFDYIYIDFFFEFLDVVVIAHTYTTRLYEIHVWICPTDNVAHIITIIMIIMVLIYLLLDICAIRFLVMRSRSQCESESRGRLCSGNDLASPRLCLCLICIQFET